MTRDDARLFTDRSWLQDVQYRTDANLAARQSIYAYQQPRLDPAGAGARAGRLRLDEGEELLAREFTSIIRHDFTGELVIPGPRPVEDYVRSMGVPGTCPTQRHSSRPWAALCPAMIRGRSGSIPTADAWSADD